jgi:hypothetical protein
MSTGTTSCQGLAWVLTDMGIRLLPFPWLFAAAHLRSSPTAGVDVPRRECRRAA